MLLGLYSKLMDLGEGAWDCGALSCLQHGRSDLIRQRQSFIPDITSFFIQLAINERERERKILKVPGGV